MHPLRILCSELFDLPDHLGSLGVTDDEVLGLVALVVVDHDRDNSVIFELHAHVSLALERQKSCYILYGLYCGEAVDVEEDNVAEDSCLAIGLANAA